MRNEITELYKMAPCLKRVAKWMVFDLNIALLWRHNPTLSFKKYSGGVEEAHRKVRRIILKTTFVQPKWQKEGFCLSLIDVVTLHMTLTPEKLSYTLWDARAMFPFYIWLYLQSYVPQSLVFCLTLGSVTSAFGPKKCIKRTTSPNTVEFLGS